MLGGFGAHIDAVLAGIRKDGFWKSERVIASAQGARIKLAGGGAVLNFCANNYLGLANDARLIEAARRALNAHGFGMASVRFICGTQDLHKELEAALARFLGVEDAILHSSCFDANGGLFECLLGEEDAVISDALNHASIIDGIRLSKARRYRYANNDMGELAARLREAEADGARFKMIATDGVFSMDGIMANLKTICDLAERHGALVMVDDSHAFGFVGANGRGSPEASAVEGRVDLLTGTFGKALGGASGGYVAGPRPLVELLRQRSRPYLFSNSLMPAIAAATLEGLALLQSDEGAALRAKAQANGRRFRAGLEQAGFRLVPGNHPIVPIMLGEASLAAGMAEALLAEGIYVIGFSYPVVPKGQARIRAQMSAAHDDADIERAIAAFVKVGRALGAI